MVISVVVASAVLVTTVVVTSEVDGTAYVVVGALVVVKRTVVVSVVVGTSMKYNASTCIRQICMIQKINMQVWKVLVSLGARGNCLIKRNKS